MSNRLSDGVVKRLNFDIDITTPVSLVARDRGNQCRLPPTSKSPTVISCRAPSTCVVRYGLPEDELANKRRPSATRSVSYRVPSDDESDSDSEVTSAFLTGTLSRSGAIEEQRRMLHQNLLASLETMRHSTQASWRSRLEKVESQLVAQFSAVSLTTLRKQRELCHEDEKLLRQQEQLRNEVLEKIASSHRTEACLQEQQVKRFAEQREEERRKEEECRRRDEEERRREAERLEAERNRKVEEARKRAEGERKQREAEAEKQRQEVEEQKKKAEAYASSAAAAAAATVAAATSRSPGPGESHPCLRISPGAQQQAANLATRLADAQAAVAPLLADQASKKNRRDIEKRLTVHVQQICGTQSQVQVKCQDVYQLVNGLQGPWRTFAVLTLCSKIIKQHDLVQRNNKAAFPLALVVVKVSNVFPELLDLFVAFIHKTCPLAIPRSYVHDTAKISNQAYFRGMGFEEQNDPSAPSGKVFECPEEYLRRVEGIMLLYGAVMQVGDPNGHGVPHAWSYLARALNYLPPDRYTAKALVSVLRVAGNSLHMSYRGQLLKMLGALQCEFLPALRSAAGDDIAALVTLLDTFVTDGLFRKPPEGRNMPAFDLSSQAGLRA